VLALSLLVVCLALADAGNPVTIAVALYLAADGSPLRLAGFTAGVFGVYAVGGLVLVLGPGQLLDGALASSQTPGFHAASVVAGTLLLLAGVGLYVRSRSGAEPPELPELGVGSALALGVGVTALDLPTAFPYLGALAAIAGSGASLGFQLLLIGAFNVIYVLPLVGIGVTLALAGERARAPLARAKGLLERTGPVLLLGLSALTGAALVLRGAHGLLG
jgi:cytochrome c biogenesis protein CcdA